MTVPATDERVVLVDTKQAKPRRGYYRTIIDQLSIVSAHQLVEQHRLHENKHADRFFS